MVCPFAGPADLAQCMHTVFDVSNQGYAMVGGGHLGLVSCVRGDGWQALLAIVRGGEGEVGERLLYLLLRSWLSLSGDANASIVHVKSGPMPSRGDQCL